MNWNLISNYIINIHSTYSDYKNLEQLNTVCKKRTLVSPDLQAGEQGPSCKKKGVKQYLYSDNEPGTYTGKIWDGHYEHPVFQMG